MRPLAGGNLLLSCYASHDSFADAQRRPGAITRCCRAGALLYDARGLFDQQNAKADEGLRSIVHSLPEAVATCVDAAQAELEEPLQIALMKVRPVPTAG